MAHNSNSLKPCFEMFRRYSQQIGLASTSIVTGSIVGILFERSKWNEEESQWKTQQAEKHEHLATAQKETERLERVLQGLADGENVPNTALRSSQLLENIGNTPLIEIPSLSKITGCTIYGKAEYMNPAGSVKDRAAKRMIEEAEKSGDLVPGATIIEGTGGNTGVALAMVAAAKGYKTVFTMPENTAKEKIELMQTFGAEVHLQPLVDQFDREHFYEKAKDLAKNMEKSFFPDQFENTANMMAHYDGTAVEILRQTKGKLDAFVCSSGTGGTVAGVTKRLKEENGDIRTFLIDPDFGAATKWFESGRKNATLENGYEMLHDTFPGSEFVITEGIGLGRVTANLKHAIVDGTFMGTNEEIVKMAYYVLKNDGIFIGPSAALNCVGAVKVAKQLGPGHTIVTILCDRGDRYTSKLFSREWLDERRLLEYTDVDNVMMSDFLEDRSLLSIDEQN